MFIYCLIIGYSINWLLQVELVNQKHPYKYHCAVWLYMHNNPMFVKFITLFSLRFTAIVVCIPWITPPPLPNIQSVCYSENHSDSDHYSCLHNHIHASNHHTLQPFFFCTCICLAYYHVRSDINNLYFCTLLNASSMDNIFIFTYFE